MRILVLIACSLIWVSLVQSELTADVPLTEGVLERSRPRPSPRPSPSPSPKPSPYNNRNRNSNSGSSFGSTLLGFVVGPILFISAFPCIWYNERRAAIEYRRIKLGKQICQDVDVYSQASAMSKNNQFVYAKGQTLTNAEIWDPICGVGGQHLIKITRRVEVLEWRSKTKKENDEQVTYYELEWVSSNSSTEGQRYNNPANWILENQTIYNQNVYLGGFTLSKDVVDLCDKTVPYQPNIDIANNVANHFQRQDRRVEAVGDYVMMTPIEQEGYVPPGFDNMQSVNNFGSGEQPVGTLRVKFDLCPIGPMSLLAKAVMVGLEQATFATFNIAQYQGTSEAGQDLFADGCCCCCCCLCTMYKHLLTPREEFLVVEEKKVEKDELFDELIAETKMFTLIFRVLAYVAMVAGICLFFSPITTLLGYIPLVGGFISGIAGFAIFIGAILVCIPLFLIAISLAWLRFHPAIGCMILSVGMAIFILFWITGGDQTSDIADG